MPSALTHVAPRLPTPQASDPGGAGGGQSQPAATPRPAPSQGHLSASALALQFATTSALKPVKKDSWFRRHFRHSRHPKLSEEQQLMNQFEEQAKLRARYVELYAQDAGAALAEAKRCIAQGDREGAALAYTRHKEMHRWAQVNKLNVHQIERQQAELANQQAFEQLRNLQAAGMERIETLRVDHGSALEHSDWLQGSLDVLDADTEKLAGTIGAMVQSEAAALAELEAAMVAEHAPQTVLAEVETLRKRPATETHQNTLPAIQMLR